MLLLSVSYIERDRFYQGEYYFLILCSLLGSMVMGSSRDLIVLFIGLELTTAPLFLLAGWRKGDVEVERGGVEVLHHRGACRPLCCSTACRWSTA